MYTCMYLLTLIIVQYEEDECFIVDANRCVSTGQSDRFPIKSTLIKQVINNSEIDTLLTPSRHSDQGRVDYTGNRAK